MEIRLLERDDDLPHWMVSSDGIFNVKYIWNNIRDQQELNHRWNAILNG